MDNIQKPIEWQDEDNNTLDFDYKATESGHAIIKVVGVGGGGSNAVRHMYQEGIQDVSFLIINTDYQALKGSPIPNKLQISDKGLGAGAKPEVARNYALQYEDQIRAALQDGTEMVFITAGMGGGTGTGAAPIVARIAHDLGILTVGIVTIPFEFEGRDKILMALEGVDAIKKHVDALLVVNNNRLIDIYPDFNFFNAFKKADDTLTIAAKSISDIINIEGYMNLDFADVSTTLRDGGVALISTGTAKGEGRVTAAIKEAITSPLLQDNDISNAKHLLFEICFSESNPVSMSEIAELNDFVKTLSSDIKVIWGAMVDNSLNDDVKLIILASGFEMDKGGRVYPHNNAVVSQPAAEVPSTDETLETIEPEIAVTEPVDTEDGDDDGPAFATGPASETIVVEQPKEDVTTTVENITTEVTKEDPTTTEAETITSNVESKEEPEVKETPLVVDPEPVKVDIPVEKLKTEDDPVKPIEKEPINQPKPANSVQDGIMNISKFYGEEMANKMQLDEARKAYYILDNDELSNEELVALIEKLPAYNRSVEELGQLKAQFRK